MKSNVALLQIKQNPCHMHPKRNNYFYNAKSTYYSRSKINCFFYIYIPTKAAHYLHKPGPIMLPF